MTWSCHHYTHKMEQRSSVLPVLIILGCRAAIRNNAKAGPSGGSSPLSKTIDHLQASVIIYFLFFKKMALLGSVRWRRETYAKCI